MITTNAEKKCAQYDESFFLSLEKLYGANNYSPLPVVLERGEGVWTWDISGKKYLDCLSAYSALNLGHCHPDIITAIKDQLDKLTLTSRAFHNTVLGPFLSHLCNYSNMEAALPMNTGAEAVESAIKIARRWAYKIKGVEPHQAEIIVADGNFHGRTTTIVGFSSDKESREYFSPFTPGFKSIPFDNPLAFQDAISKNTAAVLLEPIQGEAGVIIPQPGFLREIKKICNEHNILLILDEIQTGFCRTGAKFACNHENVQPDIMTVGKALGGGILPISAALTTRPIMDLITPGSHGSTFGGNPLACAAAMQTLKILERDQLEKRSAELGEYFLTQLKKIDSPRIREIRGKGLLIAIEFKPEYGICRPIVEALMKQGILTKDTHKYTIRFAPPLIIEKETIDWAIDTIKNTIISKNK